MRLILLIIITVAGNFVFSQNTITLLNGKTIDYHSYSIDLNKDYFKYSYFDKKGEIEKTDSIELSHIYSITENSVDSVVYQALTEDEIPADKMKYVVLGFQDAFDNHKSWPFAVTGFAIGTTSFILPVDLLLSLAIPMTYSSASFLVKPSKSRILKKMPPEYDGDYYFIGYENAAVHKNFKKAAYGSAAGAIFGIILVITVNSLTAK